VGIQAIGDAAESAEYLEAADDAGLDAIPRSLDLIRLGWLAPQYGELFVDRLLELVGGVTGTRRRFDLENRSENQRLLLRRDVLCDLLLVHQLLVQAARSASAQDSSGDVGIGVAGLEDRRGDPRHVDARQLDARGHILATLGRDLRRLRFDRRHRR